MSNKTKLDYHLYCIGLMWRGVEVNKVKRELLSDSPGHYFFKETVLNPYSFEDYQRDQAMKKESWFLRIWHRITTNSPKP